MADKYESHDELEAPRDGLANSLIVLTFIVLIVSVFVIEKVKSKFDAGMFTDKKAATP